MNDYKSISISKNEFKAKECKDLEVSILLTKDIVNEQAINLISKHFNPSEIKTLLTSKIYSVLYYNSEIWHLPNLSP